MGYWLRGMFADDGENRSGDDGKDDDSPGLRLLQPDGRAGPQGIHGDARGCVDAGIRHFDVAPMYGFGQAESCLGQFLGRHRAEVTVTTKYGIPAAKNQGWIAAARAASRPVIKAIPGLKRGLKTVGSKVAEPAGKANFTATEAQQSLERSLRELRTDRIDVWLLHEASVDDLHDVALLRLLWDAVATGKIGTFGVGSERKRVEALLAASPEYCPTVQFEWSVLDAPCAQSEASASIIAR